MNHAGPNTTTPTRAEGSFPWGDLGAIVSALADVMRAQSLQRYTSEAAGVLTDWRRRGDIGWLVQATQGVTMTSWMKGQAPRRLREKWWRLRRLIEELGFWGGLFYEYHRRGPGTQGATYRLHPRHAAYPLYFRHGASDLDVMGQVFVSLEYGPLCDMSDVHLVIDCGANVGYSSAFFLSRFPSCQVVAVEPDPGNFAMLQRNLLAYGERAKLVCAGIWSHPAPLTFSRMRYGDGREWAVQVRPCEPHENPDFQGVDIDSLLASSGFDWISLLKIDIEGAEAVLFRDKVDWLDRVAP